LTSRAVDQSLHDLLGGAAVGIFATFLITIGLLPLLGVTDPNLVLRLASAVGIIGAADGPTTLYVANHFNLREFMGPISVAAYSYMSLVPIIQPPVIYALTSEKERKIRMDFHEHTISQTVKIIFPIAITIIAGIIVPMQRALVGSLMLAPDPRMRRPGSVVQFSPGMTV